MADETRPDDIEKFLADQRSFDDRKKSLIEDLLRQRADAIKAFDEKLAKLGYRGDGAGKARKSHHKPVAPADAKGKAKA